MGRAIQRGRAALRWLRDAYRERRDGASAVPPALVELDRCTHPVLLLHGFLATRHALRVLERRLQLDGHAAFSIDLSSGLRRIDELAAQLRATVEGLYARFPGMGRLTIIGHSQGGLVGAYYVKKLGGHQLVRALITLGTPHNGAPAAIAGLPFALLARSIWQMTPQSPLIRRLREGEWPYSVRLTSLYSHRDWVALYPAALIETLDRPHLRNVRVEATHQEFLTKREIHDVILRELRGCEQPASSEIVTSAPLAENGPTRAVGLAASRGLTPARVAGDRISALA
jgi:pimeloyl-ACP methyl ester carboxylesterase